MTHQFQQIGNTQATMALNKRYRQEGPELTVAITGVPRGGTTMVAAVIEALGIDLGPQEDMRKFHFEDQHMISPHRDIQLDYLVQRNEEHDFWGWKDAVGIEPIQQLVYAIRNPHVFIIFRDALATLQGEMRFDESRPGPNRTLEDLVNTTKRWWDANWEFILHSRVPTLLISYERALQDPKGFVQEVIDFLPIEVDSEATTEATSRISPSGGYLQLRSPETKAVTSIGYIDWWYVNLKTRPDRDEHAREQFSNHGIVPNRFNAYTPEEWDGDESVVARIRARTPGAVGCYQSQTEVIRKAIGSDRIIAVCEDDVCFCEDLEDRLQDYILPWLANHNWDIFYLGATFHIPGEWWKKPDCSEWGPRYQVDAQPTDNPRIMRVFGMWGTYAYLVNPDRATLIVHMLDNNCYRSDGIDHNFMIIGDRLNQFCFVPGCAWQYDNQSDIGNGKTEFSLFKKLGPYAWQERMEDFNPENFDWSTGEYRVC